MIAIFYIFTYLVIGICVTIYDIFTDGLPSKQDCHIVAIYIVFWPLAVFLCCIEKFGKKAWSFLESIEKAGEIYREKKESENE